VSSVFGIHCQTPQLHHTLFSHSKGVQLHMTSLSLVVFECCVLIFRPPDTHVGGLMFYHGFFLLSSSFFFRCLISELTERNSTKIGHMLGRKCDLKTHVQNLGYPFP